MQKNSIAGLNKVQLAFALYDPNGEYRLAVKDIAQVLELKVNMVRGYIWRVRHPEKYASAVGRYLSKKKTTKKTEVPTQAQAKTKKVEKPKAGKKTKTNVKAQVAEIIKQARPKK